MDTNNSDKSFFTIRDTTDKVYLGVIALLVILSAALSYVVFDQKGENEVIALEREDLEIEKDNLSEELNDMLEQYNDLESENEELTEEMLQQKEEIQELLKEVEKGKVNARKVVQFRKEVRTLRTVMKGYVYTIDSLNTVNIELTNENLEVKGQLGSAQRKYQRLQKEAKNLEAKVEKASQLKTLFMEAQGVRVRFNGKQTDTRRADRVETIKVCMKIAANETTSDGAKTIYARVMSPEGKILIDPKNPTDRIPVKGIPNGNYSSKRTFRYEKQEMDMCMYVQLAEPLIPGTYLVEAFESGGLIGDTQLDLR